MHPSSVLQYPASYAVLLAVILSLTGTPTYAASKADTSKAELDALHKKLETLNKELNTSQAAHRDASDELKNSEKAISEARRKLYELRQQQKENHQALAALKKQQTELVKTLDQQQQLLGQQFYQQYLHGEQGYLQILLQQQDPNTAARELHYYSFIARARAELIAEKQDNLQQIAQINAQTTAALQEIETLKQAQEREQQSLQEQKNERSRVLKKLSSKITAQRNEIGKLKRDEKRLSNLVERLAKIAREQAAAKRKQAQPAPQKPTDKGQQAIAKNNTLPSSQYDGSHFAALKGKLRLPVRGDVTNRFGAARPDTGISWKGLFIRAEAGSEVKSVARGSVVFADWLRGFGNLIIIDHGDGYMSLYGNNQALLKKLGDNVKGGDTIAAVGNTGGNDSNGLYFELRLQSRPFDPLAWSVVK